MPSPKNVAVRANVRSMNWSGITKSVGLCSSFKRAHRRHRKNPLHAQHLHRIDIRAEVQLARQDPVTPSMPRQKRHPAPLQLAQRKHLRRLAKRRLHPLFPHIRQARHRIQPAAADNPNLCLHQTCCSFSFLAASSGHLSSISRRRLTHRCPPSPRPPQP